MTQQTEAQRLADLIDDDQIEHLPVSRSNIAAELRRLEAANERLRVALQTVADWMDSQADGQSKGGHATFDLMMLREHRDAARAAIKKAGDTK